MHRAQEKSHAKPMQLQTSSVIALTIVSPSFCEPGPHGRFDVLLGVRNPECNGNHKGVASVPTKRVPEATFDAINKRRLMFASNYDELRADSAERHSEDVVQDTVETILSRKLGLADDLEYSRLRFWAKPLIFRAGKSPILSEDDDPEELQMINVLVYLLKGRECFPSFTASYSAIEWFEVEDAMARIDGNRPFEFKGGHRPVEYICGGLCICTAEALLRHHWMPRPQATCQAYAEQRI